MVCAFAQAPVSEAYEQPLAHDNQEVSSNYDAIKALEHDIQDLRYQLEQQAHELEKIKNNNIKNVEQSVSSKDTESKIENNSDNIKNLSELKSESEFYKEAFQYIKNNQNIQGLQKMNEFISEFPNSGYIPNAHYWIGEIEMNQKNYQKALVEFQWILDNNPRSSKASYAMLKKGYVYEAQGEFIKARQILQDVMQNYPNTEVAHLAANKLQLL